MDTAASLLCLSLGCALLSGAILGAAHLTEERVAAPPGRLRPIAAHVSPAPAVREHVTVSVHTDGFARHQPPYAERNGTGFESRARIA